MVDTGAHAEPNAGTGSGAPAAVAAPAAPLSWIVVGTVLSVVSVAALVIADFRPPASVIGWVIAGPIAVSMFVIYTLRDTRARRLSGYLVSPAVNAFYWLGLAVTCAAIIVNALSIGLWLGEL